MDVKTKHMDKQLIIKQMFNYANEEHKSYLHEQAFADISNVFVDFINQPKSVHSPARWVCNAPMGHGKTSALKLFCRYLIEEKANPRDKIPLLIVIKEKGEGRIMADDIMSLGKTHKNSLQYITQENKSDIPNSSIKTAQIVIITHARFKQLALGYGDIDVYKHWEIKEKTNYWGQVPKKDQTQYIKVPRRIIIDEMPEFENSSTFDIGQDDNCINWFDKIMQVTEIREKIKTPEVQKFRKLFNGLFNSYTFDGMTDVTKKLIDENAPDDQTKLIHKFYLYVADVENLDCILDLQTHTDFLNFKRLLYQDNVGKVYKKYYSGTGEKVIVSDFVDYNNIIQEYLPDGSNKVVYSLARANILVLDGTARYNYEFYDKALFEPKIIENYNNYSRLTLHHRDINTSANSRSKEDGVLNDILYDFSSLKNKTPNIFLLPAKADIDFFLNSKMLNDFNTKALSINTESESQDSRLHLLNTRGKNDLMDITDLYITSLPRKSVEYYVKRAIALYGVDEIDIRLRKNIDDDDPTKNKDATWFNDDKLEVLYKLDLVSELLQIMHRIALRKIKSKEKIHVYISFEDITDEGSDICKIFRMLQAYFTSYNKNCSKDAVYDYVSLYNGSIYGRNEKIECFAKSVKEYLNKNGLHETKLCSKNLGETGNKIIQFFKHRNNWAENNEDIKKRFEALGLSVEEVSQRVKIFKLLS